MKHLYTPWRFRYISGQTADRTGCIFCAAAASRDRQSTLTIHVAEDNFVLMNRYPYTNGHLMIAPIAHHATLEEMSAPGRAEMMELVLHAKKALESVYQPHGFNVGMNIGECAGAGIPGHLHLHVVPRWSGDTNFMTSLAETRMVPEDLDEAYVRISRGFESPAQEVRSE